MSLGEAFVEVHADLRPFGRDLQRGLRPMVERFERELSGAVGRAVVANTPAHGRQIGDQLSNGIKNSFKDQFSKDKNVFIAIAGALGSALDNGISSLPSEVKAAIVGAIILATPVLAAFLTGALTSAIGASVAGIGTLLGFQFEEVRNRAQDFGTEIRTLLVRSASSFGQELINAFGLIETRLKILEPTLRDIFDLSAGFLEPLIQGVLNGLGEISESLRRSLGDIRPFIDELGAAIGIVLDAVGQSIEILSRSGDDGVKALRDLARVVAILITSTAVALLLFTKFYGVIRDLVLFLDRYLGVVSVGLSVLAAFFRATDNGSNRMRSFINTNGELEGSFTGLIAATDSETQALKEYSDALERASDAVKNQVSFNISWEESLDRITASIKENGRTLDIRTEKGRNNAREFLNALQIAEDRTVDLLRRGAITNEQAVSQYDQQTEALRRMAIQAGLSEEEFNALFGEMIDVARIRLNSEEMGIDSLTGELGKAGGRASKLLESLRSIQNISRGFSSAILGGIRGFSQGGVAFLPETINVAEDGPEAIVPLTKPARAAQILRQTGLDQMVGSGAASQVLVFIGNEQLDARMVSIVQKSSNAQAFALSHGTRTF